MYMESTKRSLALDVFRGLTIAGMILVNNPGSWRTSYAPLRHAEWHGCTPTDLVFPFFLFIMGVAVPLALGKRLERGDPQGAVIRKILSRTFLIFFIGLFLHAFPQFDFANLRIPGVLQRIALVYGITSIIYLKTTTRQQVWIGAACLLVYWGLMTLVPVPGVGYPNLEPTTNLGAWLDNLLLPGHLYSQTKVWDPEGLLSTMPAVTTGLIGVLTGTWLRTRQDDYRLLTGIFAAGGFFGFRGLGWGFGFSGPAAELRRPRAVQRHRDDPLV